MFRLLQNSFFFIAVIATATAQQATSLAADPLGTWKWERTFGDNSMEFTLALSHNDKGKLTGKYTVVRNGAEGEPVELDDVKCEQDKLTFRVHRERDGQAFTVVYEGKISGDEITGNAAAKFGDQDREFPWSAKRSAPANDGWISLYDGNTLEGWERVGNPQSQWVVEDDAMTASGPASMLVNTSGPYKNFRYRAEVKISDGGNSGLYFRTTRKPGFSDGYEAQIDSTHADPIRTGSLYGFAHVYQQHVKPDTWFTYELEVRDDVWRGREMTRIKITVDGNELYEYLDFELSFKEGYFAFQHHDPGSKVSIRKVEVKPLP